MSKTASKGADMDDLDLMDSDFKVNGWTYDPAEQAWTAKTGPNTWTIIKGDLDDSPSFRPRDIA